jgi:signal peptidase I
MGKTRKKRAKRPINRPATPWWARLILHTRTTVLGFLPIVAIFLGARVALAEAYRIPSGSMEPTLQVGDRIFVNKVRLGPHIPFTSASLPGYAHPRRNDIVVFVSPPQDAAIRITPTDVTPMLIKRIVGVAGDTLMLRHGRLLVNGTVAPARNTDYVLPDAIADQPQSLFSWQHRLEVRGSRFGPPPASPSLHDWGPLVVPAGMFFMLGDNRDNSVDSRYYGPVPRANLRGTPMFIYYSYDTEAGIDYFRALTDIRWRRLGIWIR